MNYIYRAKGAVVDNNRLISPAFIQVSEKGIITRISQTELKCHDAKCADLGDVLLFPGFTNAHCHLELTALGSLSSHEFAAWISELLARKSQTSAFEIQTAIDVGIQRLKQSGVTTIIDHISEETHLNAYLQDKVNLIGFGEVLGSSCLHAELQLKSQSSRAQICQFPYYPSPHSIHAVHPNILHRLFHERKTPFSVHLHESQAETQYFQLRMGPILDLKHRMNPDLSSNDHHDAVSAMAWIQKQNLKLDHTLVIHANELQPEDINFLSLQNNICIVHCPGSHEFFGHAQFPFQKLQAAGLAIAIGTDSLASNKDLDYLHELRAFTALNGELDIWSLLPLITTNALLPLNIRDRGQIKVGFYADIAVFDWDGVAGPLKVLLNTKRIRSLIRAGQIDKLTHI